MKIVVLFVLALSLASCGKSSSKAKVTSKSLSAVNASLADLGLRVGLGTLTTAIGTHVIVLCSDLTTLDATTTNRDRAEALQAYKDSMAGSDIVEFTNGTRTDVFRVDMAVNSAIFKLEQKLSETSCPAELLGSQKI